MASNTKPPAQNPPGDVPSKSQQNKTAKPTPKNTGKSGK